MQPCGGCVAAGCFGVVALAALPCVGECAVEPLDLSIRPRPLKVAFLDRMPSSLGATQGVRSVGGTVVG